MREPIAGDTVMSGKVIALTGLGSSTRRIPRMCWLRSDSCALGVQVWAQSVTRDYTVRRGLYRQNPTWRAAPPVRDRLDADLFVVLGNEPGEGCRAPGYLEGVL